MNQKNGYEQLHTLHLTYTVHQNVRQKHHGVLIQVYNRLEDPNIRFVYSTFAHLGKSILSNSQIDPIIQQTYAG